MKVLRIKIYQPTAHYRLPFTYQRRHTYPIPPYSTVIGFFCNLLGIDNQKDELYLKLKRTRISISGRFGSKITEYIWFRNLSKGAHIGRFGSVNNREINGHVEHIGGQSPMSIDTLNDVRLTIHLAYEGEDNFLEFVKSEIENPVNRLEPLHIGRAEDWIAIEELSEIFDSSKLVYDRQDGNYKNFFWIPETFVGGNDEHTSNSSFDGLLYNMPTFVTIKDYEITHNRHGVREFETKRTKLNDGLFINQPFLFDKEVKLPVFLGVL
jgi:CRISPR-associated protein Cas5t